MISIAPVLSFQPPAHCLSRVKHDARCTADGFLCILKIYKYAFAAGYVEALHCVVCAGVASKWPCAVVATSEISACTLSFSCLVNHNVKSVGSFNANFPVTCTVICFTLSASSMWLALFQPSCLCVKSFRTAESLPCLHGRAMRVSKPYISLYNPPYIPPTHCSLTPKP